MTVKPINTEYPGLDHCSVGHYSDDLVDLVKKEMSRERDQDQCEGHAQG